MNKLYIDILDNNKINNILYDNVLDDIDEYNLNGINFNFTSIFKVLDTNQGFYVSLHKLYKRSYKSYEQEMGIIMNKNPININNMLNFEISEFKINKQYKGFFNINYYENKTFDIFLTDYKNI